MSARAPGWRVNSARAPATVRSMARRTSLSSSSALARSSAWTAIELVAGSAPSRYSLGRTMSFSASSPVVKNPPAPSSQNSSSSSRLTRWARARQSAFPVSSDSRVHASMSQAWSAATARCRARPPCQLRISRGPSYMADMRNSPISSARRA